MMYDFTIIGTPLKHTLSPSMHNSAFKHLGLSNTYGKDEILSASSLPSFVEKARKYLKGFNVTLPYKSEIIQYLDLVSEEATLANSVNTVLVKDEKLIGFTTDGYGFQKAIEGSFNIKVESKSFVFIGFGGAVNSVIAKLLLSGTKSITIFNRTINKSNDFLHLLHKKFPDSTIEIYPLDKILYYKRELSENSIIVQSTPLGLNNNDPLPIPIDFIEPTYSIFDMIYSKTKIIEEALRIGCKAVNGIDMLLYQGAKAFEIWTNKEAPVDIMKNTLISKLKS